MARGVEGGFERVLFASRWLMAPIYLGLVGALGMLLVVFARQLAYYLPQSLGMDVETAILATLTLIDLALVGNLLVIVILSGYESVVGRIALAEGDERPSWLGTVDFQGLKMKLIASIVAISAIDLLKRFMAIGGDGSGGAEPRMADPALMWSVAIHLTFVASGVLMALMDWLSARSGKHG